MLKSFAERGTLVAPEAAARLRGLPEACERLLGLSELPFLITLEVVEGILDSGDSAAAAPPVPPAPVPPVEPARPSTPLAEVDARDPDEREPDEFMPPAKAAVVEARPHPSPPSAAAPTPDSAPPPVSVPTPASAPAATPALVPPKPAPVPPTDERAAAAAALVAEVIVPPPFTPDNRGALLEEPVVPKPVRRVGSEFPDRPRLVEPYAHKVDILADVTGNSTCEGAITDFTRYFQDRLNKIRKLLRQRREMVGFVPINKARSGTAEVKLVGMVTEIRTTKNGHRLLELEDETGTVNILAPASDNQLILEADTIIEDEVIGVTCKPPGRGDLLILTHVVRPDVPLQKTGSRSPNASAVAVLSDLHFGSKTFLQEDWDRFLRWINLEWGDSRMKALARKTRYLVINGDVVDGIGIFPGQEEELAIVDAYDQYAFAGEQLNRIRDDIKVFVLPGNHDLVRPAEPQPALPDKYKRLFPESVTHIGNPCKLSIEGVEILAYHGRSMDDWITRVSGLSYENPIAAMKEMMQRRHMVPVYGLRTPIAPEHKDYLAIDTVPDVFITGHVHAAGLEQYRGVTLINASCWQSQTAYQKMHGFQPEPSKVPVIELDTGKPWMVDFHRGKPTGVDVVGRSQFGEAFRNPAKIDNPGDIV